MASLETLPEELIDMIMEYLFQIDIDHLSLASKAYYRRFQPYSRRDVIVQFNEIGRVKVSANLLASPSFSGQWSLTQCLEFNAPIREHEGTVWHMGCCVPESILGPSGYILTKQPSISTLSLITSHNCRHAASLRGMTRLRRLKAFSWQAVRSKRDLEIFRSVVQNNADTLGSLEVRVLQDVQDSVDDDDSVLERLGLLLPASVAAPADQKCVRLSLHHLSLRRAHLDDCFAGRDFAFRLESLLSLDLVNCHGTFEFFEALLDSVLRLNLHVLKVTITEAEWGVHMFSSSPLGKVIASFSGLEEVVILTNSNCGYDHRDENNPKVMRRLEQTLPVASHADTLKRLVYQNNCTGDNDGLYVAGCDYRVRSTFPVGNLLESLPRLECLGIWILPTAFKRDVPSAGAFHSLKLLHFRMDGKPSQVDVVQQLVNSGYPPGLIPPSIRKGRQYERERSMKVRDDTFVLLQLVEFATWAFGPAGFPNLQLIAYGNFSSESCKWSRVLLCRDPSGGQTSGFLPRWLQAWPGRILGYGGAHGSDQQEHPNPLPFKLIHSDSVYPVVEIEGAWDFLRESRVGHPVRAVPAGSELKETQPIHSSELSSASELKPCRQHPILQMPQPIFIFSISKPTTSTTQTMQSPRIGLIVCSQRSPRAGLQIGQFVLHTIASGFPAADVSLIDLAEWNLPLYNEPDIPSQITSVDQYTHAHTKAWSKEISSHDAFIFVTPQYNWGYPASIKNAIDYLYHEWKGKPALIVSYGGHGGGKAAAQLHQVLQGVRMNPMSRRISLTFPDKATVIRAATGGDLELAKDGGLWAEECEGIREAFGELLQLAAVSGPTAV
ncbi:NADPH-dependent FMN reductase [Aspergillus terreus]|uniref:NADPH-dependent FMN reductase n=1 Tax=Aspergillus terreus TaxID=33178 RepID=A0A5M3ZBK5_ASPTE|nr:hypothetical protein ATETN484_0011006000 [Aspergillus terreus]GFF18697.1 NADPH-dependent FMN reductase [Aspergillus terreus]